MIKEEFVEVKIWRTTAKYYQEKGYDCEIGDIVKIKVCDLLKYSRVRITAICSNPDCKSPEITTTYNNYTNIQLSTEISDYYCKACTHIKNFRLAELKQQKGELTRKDKYYYQFAENRINEFNKYIEKYKVIDKMRYTDNSLYIGITRNSDGIISLAQELGYNINDICNGYIDNRGDYNRSKIECYLANYLIANGLEDYYQRDVVIDAKYGKYNTDFVLRCEEQDKDICIEVWGFCHDGLPSEITTQYRETKKIKESIYDMHKSTKILISFEWKDFECNFMQMQSNFEYKLKPYINMDLKKVEWNQICSFRDYTEEDIMIEILKYSKNGIMPTRNDYYKTADGRSLYSFLCKNFKNAQEYFGNKLNLHRKQKMHFWNIDKVNNVYIHMLNNYNKFLTDTELRKYKSCDNILLGFEPYVSGNGGNTINRLKFCKHYLEELKENEHLNIIKDCLLSLSRSKKVDINQEAKILLEKYFSTNNSN